MDLLDAFADAAVGDLDKEALKMRIKIFMRVRMAEGDDRQTAWAKTISRMKEFQKLKNGLSAVTGK